MLPKDCLRAYRNNAVLTASQGQLVLMLYDGALRALDVAAEALGRPEDDLRRIEVINNSLVKAQTIIAELRGTLDFDAGGELAKSLDQLYDYYHRRLDQANIRKDLQPIAEVQRLLKDLRDGWAEMLAKGADSSPAGARGTA